MVRVVTINPPRFVSDRSSAMYTLLVVENHGNVKNVLAEFQAEYSQTKLNYVRQNLCSFLFSTQQNVE